MATWPGIAEISSLIGQYSHEAHRPSADTALHTLRRVASMVKPIMRQRGWRVGTLSEFYPEQKNLLGLNVNNGHRICLRLRYPNDENLFLPFEQVIDTMLHELTHNVFGPHDEKFHRLWNELRDEYEALTRKGYTGEGFLSPGYQLGGSGTRPPQEVRRMARAAAEKRRAQSGAGPRRVGGLGPSQVVDIRKTIADAAQRRRDILKGCGDTDTDPKVRDQVVEETKRNGVQTAAEIDDDYMQAVQLAFMDMVREEADGHSKPEASPPVQSHDHMQAIQQAFMDMVKEAGSKNQSGPSSTITGNSSSYGVTTLRSTTEYKDIISSSSAPPVDDDKWECPICTFRNSATFLCCEVCLIERPSEPTVPIPRRPQSRLVTQSAKPPPGDHKVLRSRAAAANIARFKEAEEKSANSKPLGWTCHHCGTYTEQQWWLCSACGTMKLSS